MTWLSLVLYYCGSHELDFFGIFLVWCVIRVSFALWRQNIRSRSSDESQCHAEFTCIWYCSRFPVRHHHQLVLEFDKWLSSFLPPKVESEAMRATRWDRWGSHKFASWRWTPRWLAVTLSRSWAGPEPVLWCFFLTCGFQHPPSSTNPLNIWSPTNTYQTESDWFVSSMSLEGKNFLNLGGLFLFLFFMYSFLGSSGDWAACRPTDMAGGFLHHPVVGTRSKRQFVLKQLWCRRNSQMICLRTLLVDSYRWRLGGWDSQQAKGTPGFFGGHAGFSALHPVWSHTYFVFIWFYMYTHTYTQLYI